MKLHRFNTLHESSEQNLKVPDVRADITDATEAPKIETDLQFITHVINSDDCVVPAHARKAAKQFFANLLALINGDAEDLACIFAYIQSHKAEYFKLFGVAGSLEDRPDLLVKHYKEFKSKFADKVFFQPLTVGLLNKDIQMCAPTGKYTHYFYTNESENKKK